MATAEICVAERLPYSSHCKNLFTLTPEDQEIARERVRLFDGLADIRVHPFFYHGSDNPPARVIEVEAACLHAISQPPDQTPLQIIFEENHRLEQTMSRLHPVCQTSNQITYFIPTIQGGPVPIYYSYQDRLAWQNLSNYLGNLGVRSLTVGGILMYLTEIDPELLEDEEMADLFRMSDSQLRFPGGCAGMTATRLLTNFAVTLSDMSYPERLSDYRAAI